MAGTNAMCEFCDHFAEVFCTCSHPETLVCVSCFMKHISTKTETPHPGRGIAELHYYQLPGYYEKLKIRRKNLIQIEEETHRSIDTIDTAMEDITATADRLIQEIKAYESKLVKELRQVKRNLEQSFEEVRSTLEIPHPTLGTKYGPMMRMLTKTSKCPVIFTYSLQTSSIPPFFLSCALFPSQEVEYIHTSEWGIDVRRVAVPDLIDYPKPSDLKFDTEIRSWAQWLAPDRFPQFQDLTILQERQQLPRWLSPDTFPSTGLVPPTVYTELLPLQLWLAPDRFPQFPDLTFPQKRQQLPRWLSPDAFPSTGLVPPTVYTELLTLPLWLSPDGFPQFESLSPPTVPDPLPYTPERLPGTRVVPLTPVSLNGCLQTAECCSWTFQSSVVFHYGCYPDDFPQPLYRYQ